MDVLKRVASELSARTRVRLGRPVSVKYNGTRFLINPDASAAYHARESTDKIAAMAQLIEADSAIVFDVGANCGLFSAFVAHRLPNVRVVAFEPSRDLVPYIETNCAQLAVTVEEVAVSEVVGTATLHVNAASQQTNSLQVEAVAAFGSVTESRQVQCVTLDQYVVDHHIARVDVLKIDVQGGEGAVLRGGRRVLEGVQQLFIESTWLDPESIPGVITLGLHYGFTHLSVVNPVRFGADLLLSRAEPRGNVVGCHQLSTDLLSSRWLGS